MIFLLSLHVIPQYTMFCTMRKKIIKRNWCILTWPLFFLLHRIQKCWSIWCTGLPKGAYILYIIIKCLFFFFDQPWTTLFVAVKSFLWFGLFLPANEGIEATTGNTSAVRRLGLFQISLILYSFLSDPLLDSEKGKQKLSCLSDF